MLKIFRTAIIVALAAFILFPMLYTFSLSFFQGLDFTDSYAHFLPSSFSLRNYILASSDRYFPRYALNSLITAFLTASIRLVITTFSAFTFTHLEFRGRKAIFILLTATLFIPSDAILFENYTTIAKAGMLDTYQGIILPSLFSASSLLFMIGGFSSYDRDVYDAARLDGAGDIRYMSSILIHLTTAVSATIFIQTFIASFGSYLWPLLVTNRPRMRTVQVGITMLGFAADGETGAQFASIIMITLPFVILLQILRRRVMNAMDIKEDNFR